MKKIFIVRHGETGTNEQNLVSGSLNVQLNETGRNQIELLSGRLQKYNIDAIYSSDLDRAKDTASIIGEYHPKISVFLQPELADKNFGIFQGKPVKEYVAAFKKSGLSHQHFEPEGGESQIQVEERVSTALQEILKSNYQSVLISGHGSINRTLLKLLLNLSYEERRKISQNNACLNILSEMSEGEFEIELINCTKHLL